jgi:hypothetical protein
MGVGMKDIAAIEMIFHLKRFQNADSSEKYNQSLK